MSYCFSFSLKLPFPTDSPCGALLAVEPGLNGVVLERMVCVTGMSSGTGDGLGEDESGEGDDGPDPDTFGD